MEKRKYATNKQGKNKGVISINGGNIGGLVVWVGAMAAAGLVAAFTVKKCIRRDTDKKEETGSKGMRSTLQSSATLPCSKTNGSTKKLEIQDGSCDLASSESSISNLVQGTNPTPMTNGGNGSCSGEQREILVIDESKQETGASCDGCASFESNHKVVDEYSLPELDVPLMDAEKGKTENDTGDDWQLIQGTEVLKEKGLVDSEKVTEEKSSIGIGEEGLINESKQAELAGSEFDDPSMNDGTSEIESESGENWQLMPEILVLKDVVGGSEKVTTVEVNELKQETVNERVSFESSYEGSDEFALPELDDPSMDEAKSEIENESREDLQPKQGIKVWTAGEEDSGKKTTEENSIRIDEVGDEQKDSSEECVQEQGEEISEEARSSSTNSINEKVEDEWQLMERVTATDEEEAIDTEKAVEKSSLVDSDKEVKEGKVNEENESAEDSPSTESSEVDDWEEEDDEEEGGNEEYIMQKGEESSEGTGSTSPESNAEAVWPVEVIEEFPMKLQKTPKDLEKEIVDMNTPAEKEGLGKFNSSNGGKDGDQDHQATEKVVLPEEKGTHETTMKMNYQTDPSTKWMIWVWSTSTVLLLVLLLLARHSALSYRSIDREPSLFHEL